MTSGLFNSDCSKDAPRPWSAERFNLMDRLATDRNVTDLDVRLFWLVSGKMSEEHGRKCWASRETIATEAGVTVDAISRSAKRLCSGGYLRKVQDKDFRTSVYSLGKTTLNADDNDPTVVHERLQDHVVNDPTVVPITTLGSHNLPSSNSLNKTPNKNTKKDFDEFWALWPKKVSKANAEKAFKKAIKKIDFDALIAAAKQFAQSKQNTELIFIPHASTWLNGERWNDDVISDATTEPHSGINHGQSGFAPSTYKEPWRARLIGWRDNEFWPGQFGPEPGEPDCGAPKELIEEILGEAPRNCSSALKKQGQKAVTL